MRIVFFGVTAGAIVDYVDVFGQKSCHEQNVAVYGHKVAKVFAVALTAFGAEFFKFLT